MTALLRVSSAIDTIIEKIAMVFVWASVLLMFAVIYDVVTRYFGLPRGFGLNATILQESEYWFHTFLFAFTLAWAYRRQSHVRIDLIRDRLPIRMKYLVEFIGCLLFLIPYSAVVLYFTYDYTIQSFIQDEVSKSGVGMTNVWIVKAAIPAMCLLLLMAGISHLIKSLAGFLGKLPPALATETLGGDN